MAIQGMSGASVGQTRATDGASVPERYAHRAAAGRDSVRCEEQEVRQRAFQALAANVLTLHLGDTTQRLATDVEQQLKALPPHSAVLQTTRAIWLPASPAIPEAPIPSSVQPMPRDPATAQIQG